MELISEEMWKQFNQAVAEFKGDILRLHGLSIVDRIFHPPTFDEPVPFVDAHGDPVKFTMKDQGLPFRFKDPEATMPLPTECPHCLERALYVQGENCLNHFRNYECGNCHYTMTGVPVVDRDGVPVPVPVKPTSLTMEDGTEKRETRSDRALRLADRDFSFVQVKGRAIKSPPDSCRAAWEQLVAAAQPLDSLPIHQGDADPDAIRAEQARRARELPKLF
jgi:hypothetical protein